MSFFILVGWHSQLGHNHRLHFLNSDSSFDSLSLSIQTFLFFPSIWLPHDFQFFNFHRTELLSENFRSLVEIIGLPQLWSGNIVDQITMGLDSYGVQKGWSFPETDCTEKKRWLKYIIQEQSPWNEKRKSSSVNHQAIHQTLKSSNNITSLSLSWKKCLIMTVNKSLFKMENLREKQRSMMARNPFVKNYY